MKKIRDVHSRAPIERMMRIHNEIVSGKFPNATGLAQLFEVSSKSIHRDIDFMRDRLGLPLAYDGRKYGYYYTEEVASFPAVQLTEGELFSMMVAEKALQQYRGTNFERPLVSAFKKMAASLPETISIHLPDWEETISFRTSAEPIINLETFQVLSKATAEHKQLEIAYRKAGQQKTEQRIVDPYQLANVNGEWFLFAFDHLRKDVRTFAPSRIHSLKLTGKRFARPHRFSLEKRLRDSFGVHSGQGEFKVVVRFDEFAADYIREKRWHASQQLKELPGGGLDLHLKLSSLGEVERWILGWAGHATVLQPPELAASVKRAAEAILKAAAR